MAPAEYTAADGAAMFTHKGTNACDAVSFTYAAADADTGAAEIGAALRKLYGVTISFR